MRIGIDVSQLGCEWDGIGVYIYNFLQYVMDNPCREEFVLYSDRPLMKSVNLNKNFHIVADKTYNHLLWLLIKLPKHIKHDYIDIFWQPNFLLPYKIGGTKNIVTVHDMSAYSYWHYATLKTQITHKLFLKRTCKCADKIITISNNCKSEMCQCLKIDSQKVTTIYNGKRMFENGLDATEEECVQYLNGYNLKRNSYLLFVGTLSPRKNPQTIISAFIRYKRNDGRCKLVLAGNISDSCKKIVNKVLNSEYKDDVVITGYINEKEKRILYYNCRLVLYPSLLEGFGFPILEAFQAGKPVITSNISCMPEIAQKGAIYLNDVNSAEELSQKISEADNLSEHELKALIDTGYERVEYFDKLNYPLKTLEMIRSMR